MLPAESKETQRAAFRNTKDYSKAGKYNDEIGQFSLDVLPDIFFFPPKPEHLLGLVLKKNQNTVGISNSY